MKTKQAIGKLNVLVDIFEDFYSRYTILVIINIDSDEDGDETGNVLIYFRNDKI